MKGGPSKLRWRGKQLSLILIVLVCATILLWTWDRSPVLTSSLPQKNQLLQLSPEHKRHAIDDIPTFKQREAIKNKGEDHVDEIPSADTGTVKNKGEDHVDEVPSTNMDTAGSSSGFETVPIHKKSDLLFLSPKLKIKYVIIAGANVLD